MSMHHWVFGLGMIIALAFQVYLIATNQIMVLVAWSLGYFMCIVSNIALTEIQEQKRIRGQPQVINYQNLIDDLEFKPK
jgi:hypothetical protein